MLRLLMYPAMLLSLVIGAAAQVASTGQSKSVPLTAVAIVADLDIVAYPDNPGTGGGFETAAYFQTRLADSRAIRECMKPIERVAGEWAAALGLVRSLKDQVGSALTLHFAKPGMAGFFAVTYSVEERTKARVRVDFFLLDGTPRSPELIRELLVTYRIAPLQDSFDVAIRCDGRPS